MTVSDLLLATAQMAPTLRESLAEVEARIGKCRETFARPVDDDFVLIGYLHTAYRLAVRAEAKLAEVKR